VEEKAEKEKRSLGLGFEVCVPRGLEATDICVMLCEKENLVELELP
jgi:hypothetical protein